MAVAGAGSGKTRVLTNKIAYLIETAGIPATNILAITFTNRAAEEMRNRVFRMLDIPLKGIWISTFHAMGAKILRYDIHHLGYSNDFQIVDDEDVHIIVKNLLKEHGYDLKMYSGRMVADLVGKIKSRPEKLSLLVEPIKSVMDEIYPAYKKYLKENNLVDFEDLLVLVLELFKNYPDVLEKYQSIFEYILVDEFQDTNDLQYEIVHLLARKHHNIFIVGDEDQSIYSFRGSNIENIRKFMRDFPDHHKVVLNQNYRSRTNILNAANSVISHNVNRIPKELFSELGEGDKIQHFRAQNDEEEVYYIYNKIRNLLKEGYEYQDIAVLYRNNAMSRKFEDLFLRYNVPHKVIGNISFYKRKEIKDIIAYLRLLIDRGDNYAFTRIYNEPKRGIGPYSFDKITSYASENNIKLMDAIDDTIGGVPVKGLEKLRQLKRELITIRKNMENVNLLETYDKLLEVTGYVDMLKNENWSEEKKIEAERRIDNLHEFKTVILEKIRSYDKDISNFDKLLEILTDLALREEAEELLEDNRFVSLMTTHSAKGLEFKVVFIACLEQTLFPSSQSLFEKTDVEEERRLFYVALTRAKEKVFLTNARERYMYGHLMANQDSQFINEIDERFIEHSGIGIPKEPDYERPRHHETNRVVPKIDIAYEPVHNVLVIGDRIEHQTFGSGVVVSLNNDKVTIAFQHDVGIKILMRDHPSIKKVARSR